MYACTHVRIYAKSSRPASCEPPKELTTQIPPWGPSGAFRAANQPSQPPLAPFYADANVECEHARWPSTEKLAVSSVMQRKMFCSLGSNIATTDSAPMSGQFDMYRSNLSICPSESGVWYVSRHAYHIDGGFAPANRQENFVC